MKRRFLSGVGLPPIGSQCRDHSVVGSIGRPWIILRLSVVTVPLPGQQFVVVNRPTYCGHPVSWEYVTPSETVTFLHEGMREGRRVAFVNRKSGASLSIDVDSLTPEPQSRCGSCSQHERVTSLEGMLRRTQDELCLALNGMHHEQGGGAGGVLMCPHGARAEGLPAKQAVEAIRLLCGRCADMASRMPL